MTARPLLARDAPVPGAPLLVVPLLVVIYALGSASAAARAESGPEFRSPEGGVRLVSAWASAPAGGDARLGLAFDLAPGWHVYWKNPGDAGYPPELRFAPGAPLGEATLLYPAPERYELPGELVAYGYSGRTIYPVDARLAGGAAGPARIAATLVYLVCAESCVPYTAELALELPVGEAVEDPEVAPALDAWRARLPRPADELERVAATLVRAADGVLELRLTLVGEGLRALAPELFFETHPRVELGRPRFAAAADGPGFVVGLRPLDAGRPLVEPLRLAWTATGFERAGRPAAWAGTVAVVPPAARGLSPARIALAALLLVFVALALAARRRRARSTSPEVVP
jgi:suppressor for copper-sensitivity B